MHRRGVLQSVRVTGKTIIGPKQYRARKHKFHTELYIMNIKFNGTYKPYKKQQQQNSCNNKTNIYVRCANVSKQRCRQSLCYRRAALVDFIISREKKQAYAIGPAIRDGPKVRF